MAAAASETAEEEAKPASAVRPINLFKLPTELNDCVYTSEKYPLLVDPTGQAGQYLKYRARYLSVFKKGDFEKDSLRRGLVQALHNGATLVLDFDKLDCDLSQHFDKDNFPEAVLNPHQLFLPETYEPLLRKTDEFSAKVTYEHQAAAAEGAFQDRTKAHAPERCADVDSSFDPKESFRLVVITKKEEVLPELLEKMCAYHVECSQEQVDNNAGTWAGGSRPKQDKSKEQLQMDTDLLEFAFDGEVEEIKKCLEKGADPLAKEGRGHSALSEAAVKGHLETVKALLDWKSPIGSDPNSFGGDGRTALHRAAFGNFTETVQLLLERGSDPRIKDRNGEKAFDLCTEAATQEVMTAWDIEKTDKLREERRIAIDKEDEEHVKNDEERQQLAKRKKMKTMAEHAEAGEKDLLELEIMDIDRNQLPTYRDERGNSVLHIAVNAGKLDCVKFLIDEMGMGVNLRDAKGWTCIAVAAFAGHKNLCRELMGRRADPSMANAYHKDAFDVSKDDEIREVLNNPGLFLGPGAEQRPETPAELLASLEKDDEPKAKGKAKSRPSAKGDAKAKAAPKTEAKAKAKPKAKGKS